VYKYDKQVKKYQNFAKENFSVSKYENAMNSINTIGGEEFQNRFESLYKPGRDSYCAAFFGKNTTASDLCNKNFGIDDSRNPKDGDPYSSEFYRAITSENFIPGWNDVAGFDPSAISAHLQVSDAYMPLGSSNNYRKYLSLREKANDYADRQAIFLGAIILNHIVSAIDAALSARAHNNSLYEEKISFLDKIRPSSDLSLGENFKVGAGLIYFF
jgi:hypothetical protein